MKKEREEKYEAPLTKRTQVSLESGICGSSSGNVVEESSDNAIVDIEEQGKGGSFTIDSWD